MAEFVYTTVPGKIKPLLTKIREVGVPSKATVQWLKSIGFKSSNDAFLLGVLKHVGLIDASGIPTPTWTQYRGSEHRRVLGDAIRKGYAELFAVYPNANDRSQTEIEHVFSTSSTGGKQVIAKTVSTFKTLAEQADFPPVGEQTELHMSSGPLHTPATQALPPARQSAAAPAGPGLHIDVQIHIAPEASAEQIDQIFASMAKHLYGSPKA
jgi:hypothetical protein